MNTSNFTELEKDDNENDTPTLEDLLSRTDSDYHGLVKYIFKNNLKIPIPGFELTNKNGKTIGNAELAWPDLKVALLTERDFEYKPEFEKKEWIVFDITEVNSLPENLKTILE